MLLINLNIFSQLKMSLDEGKPKPILGLADDDEILEITKDFCKLLLKENSVKKQKKDKTIDDIGKGFSLLNLGKDNNKTDNSFEFDELLGLVNDIEREHLIDLKNKIDNEKTKLMFNVNNKLKLEKIIYEHFQLNFIIFI